MGVRAFAIASLACCAFLVGCDVSPRPEPPTMGSRTNVPAADSSGSTSEDFGAWDTSRISLRTCGGTCDRDPFFIVGQPGAVVMPDATSEVWAVDLDGTDSPASVPVNPDGSFTLALRGRIGDEIRFQLLNSAGRIPPVDFVLSAESTSVIYPVQHPMPCLALSPMFEVELAAVGSSAVALEVANLCGDAVIIDAISFRVPFPPVEVDPPAMTVLPGESRLVILRYTGEGTPPAREILFVHAEQPVPDRRPITVLLGR